MTFSIISLRCQKGSKLVTCTQVEAEKQYTESCTRFQRFDQVINWPVYFYNRQNSCLIVVYLASC